MAELRFADPTIYNTQPYTRSMALLAAGVNNTVCEAVLNGVDAIIM